MTWRNLGRREFLVSTTAVALSMAISRAMAEAIPAKPEAGSIKMGLEPWLGYGQWHVAAKKGYFKAAGLDDVELVNFTQDADLNGALASGKLDVANVATHTAMAMVAAGLPIKIVLLLDVSMTADAMLSNGEVGSVSELKGKSIAFEEGTTSDILLNYVLAKNGMSINDIKKVPMPAADAGTALIAGRVPVAVTYEPYISIAKTQSKKVKLLASAGEDPGLISDVLVVREEFLKNKPGQIAALIKVWDEALAFYRSNEKEGQAIIAEAVGAKPEELETGFQGVRYYSLAENKKHLQGDYLKKVMPDVKAAATKANLLTKDINVATLIDGRFVAAVAG
jgi:NitT/TauT family transport system substrate-binding protein